MAINLRGDGLGHFGVQVRVLGQVEDPGKSFGVELHVGILFLLFDDVLRLQERVSQQAGLQGLEPGEGRREKDS
ncbi:MAG: hypothetical protein BJ554DRAFT_602 [Olpidium bornovanus]|uniref:Uncharacterized protein n=1 Tax=Olpidium bornovanus TaxID=278681 RepID=A0A8H8DLT6_9FUNG|nr:MAG: hypothetical protein BJ554DRAFT_602 [Olpidium bornovanus]